MEHLEEKRQQNFYLWFKFSKISPINHPPTNFSSLLWVKFPRKALLNSMTSVVFLPLWLCCSKTRDDIVRRDERRLCGWLSPRLNRFMGLGSVWSVKVMFYTHFRNRFLVSGYHLWFVVVSITSWPFWLFSRNVTSWYTRGPHLHCGCALGCHSWELDCK